MKVPTTLFALLLGLARFSFPATAQIDPARLVLEQQDYTLTPGQSIRLPMSQETHNFVRDAPQRSLTLHGPSDKGLAAGPNAAGDAILLSASLVATPGDYNVDLEVQSGGEKRSTTFHVKVLPLATVPNSATQPPVILLNGWTPGTTSCFLASSTADSFGSLATQLINAGVPVVYFFDNCAECANCTIENLGIVLSQLMASIEYTNGTLVPQVDLIAFDIGGLVARAYLSGFQPSGAFATPVSPRIHKFVEIATPNFGAFLATQFQSQQTIEFAPGSPLIWNLARWNQGTEDLRGVDALAIIGNAGALNGVTGESDGVVSTTSASLGFVTGIAQNRTRILNYCHTTNNANVSCTNPVPISNVDAAPLTGQILLSFLANTSTWTTIGGTPSTDPFLGSNGNLGSTGNLGGVLFALVTATNVIAADLSSVSIGSVPLQGGTPAGEFFYIEDVRGTGALAVNSSSLGSLNCGNYTVIAGRYSSVRCKFSPFISGVTPLVTSAAGTVVEDGTTITITGSGFGSHCNGCQVVAYPNATTPGVTLAISSWTNTAIAAALPSTFQGFYQLVVAAASGSDSINIVTPGTLPTLNSAGVVNGASFASAAAIAPGSIASAFGTSLASSTASATAVPLPNTLGGTQLFVNGSVVPLFYVSPPQINFQAPFIAAGSATFQVVSGSVTGPVINATIAAAAPGIFSIASSGAGQGAVLNQDSSLNSASNPATQGSVVQIYCTGLGAVNPVLAAGSPGASSEPFNRTVVTPTVMIGGVNAGVQFSAIAPGFVGLYQVNAQVPTGVSGSAVSLQVSSGGQASNTVTIAVQ